MAVLHLENVPEELYRSIEQLATVDRLPLSEATLRLLSEAIDRRQAKSAMVSTIRSQREILDEIARHRITPAPGTPDSVEMLREDRNR